MSLAGGYSSRDGYTINQYSATRSTAGRPTFGKGQLLLKSSERFDARLIVSARRH